MGFTVTLQPSGHAFEVPEGQNVLQAGLGAGHMLPYSCRAGVCRTCRGTILEGKVDYGLVHDTYLPESDKAKGYALLCQAKPLSDLVVEVREVQGVRPKIIPCRVEKLDKPAPDVAIIGLRLPMNENFRFLAGQYIDFLLKDGKRRSFSLATPPHDDKLLELHVRHVPQGFFTDALFTQYKGREILRFEGPLGSFYLRETSDKPIIFVAGGTGFAPIKAIIEHALHHQVPREMVLYWGARSLVDLYLPHLPGTWQTSHPNFTYIPVLSEPKPEDAWSGRTGFVHEAVMADFPDMSGYQVYACGAPLMIDAAKRDFTQRCGLPADEFFADSFTYAAETEALP
jgi:CDP-4-dehydro-6-deoxyglucose reductase